MNLKIGLKKQEKKVSSPISKPQIKPKQPSKPIILFGQEINSEFLKREFNFFIDFIKETKVGKILLGVLGFIIILSFILIVFFSGAPAIISVPLFLLVLFISIFGFFIEIILLKKEQLLVGVYILDFLYFSKKSLLKKISELEKKPFKEQKVPWLLINFKNILRFNSPFFKRITKDQFAKLTKIKQDKYMKKYQDYLKKINQK